MVRGCCQKGFPDKTKRKQQLYLPGNVEFIVTNKVGMVTFQGVQDQSFIGLRNVSVGETPLVSEIHFGGDGPSIKTRLLGVELHVDGFGRLYAKNELVTGDVLEDTLSDILVLDTNFHFGFVQG